MTTRDNDQAEICAELFATPPTGYEFPGGRGRKTFVAVFDEARFVVSRRSGPGRAALEARILTALAGGGHAPGLVRRKGALIVQDYVAGIRLSEAMDAAETDVQAQLLGEACDSLLTLQEAGRAAGLTAVAPRIGERPGWNRDLIEVPVRLASEIGLPAPQFDADRLTACIASRHADFVKWDARPGNALVRQDGSLCWFDWEHCGLRSSRDDLAWLLADEWSPDAPEVEGQVMQRVASTSGQNLDVVTLRFRTMALLHTFVRLSLILNRTKSRGWGNHAKLLRHDQIGTTPAHVQRLCQRGSRWAAETAGLAGYLPLLEGIAQAGRHA